MGRSLTALATLLIDGEPAGQMENRSGLLAHDFRGPVLDIGLDPWYNRSLTMTAVGRHLGPNTYQGDLVRVSVDLEPDQGR